MIFVTVGTHEQPFDRLVKTMDELLSTSLSGEKCFIQTGFTTYQPKHAEWSAFLSYQQMRRAMVDADIIITHGGPASFLEALSLKKRPIVVPRQKRFNEHVNNHQIIFARQLKERNYPIDVVEDISELLGTINDNKNKTGEFNSNNERFITKFESLIDSLGL